MNVMKFLKTFLAALLAVIVGFGLLVMIWAMIIAGIVASFGSRAPVVASDSVLRLNVGTVTDAPPATPFADFDFMAMKKGSRHSLLSVLDAIDKAASDDRIKGIYINFDESTSVFLSSLEEIRAALGKFRESGKFIVAYGEYYGKTAYYLASVADRIYLNPEGAMDWTGMTIGMMFYKGLLEKLDIQPIVLRHGTFKSAVEPYINDRMSPENRLQMQTLANSIWSLIVDAVSASRGIAASDLNAWADNLTINTPQAALEKRLIDGVVYEDEVMAMLYQMSRQTAEPLVEGGEDSRPAENEAVDAEEEVWTSSGEVVAETETVVAEAEPDENASVEATGEETAPEQPERSSKSRDPKIVSFGDYVSQPAHGVKKLSKNKVAVIYAEGSIVTGEGGQGEVGSSSLAARLAKVRKDANVKAVVVRVNSPGGSALASEVIWREMELLRAEVPVIVSMGTYAASGGYYISAPADVIYANNSTITGSIGVFAMFANIGRTLKNKIGVTIDRVNTNSHSDMGSVFRDLQPAERIFLQNYVENTYKTFVNHVAAGRNMTFEAVDNIGQGRVWTGSDARRIGLVDGIGGMREAVAIAADRAGVGEDFRVWEVLDDQTDFFALLTSLTSSVRSLAVRDRLGEAFEQYDNLLRSLTEEGVQARLPYVIEIE